MRPSFIILSLVVLSSAVHAADLGQASAFNAFIFNDAHVTNSDSFGPVAVGHNLTLDNYQVNTRNLGANLSGMSNIGLLVGNDLSALGGAARVERGNAYVRGSVSGNLLFNGGALTTGATVDTSVFASQHSYSTGQSSAIRSLAATTVTGGGPAWPNVLTIDLSTVATVNGRQVLRIDGSLINGNANVALNLTNGNAANTVIFDVLGASVNWTWVTNYANTDKLLWNFQDATNLTVGRQFNGSILAPNASVTQNELIQGNLIAQNWIGSSREMHFALDTHPFGGDAPVPEPISFLGLGVGLAAFVRRRRPDAQI